MTAAATATEYLEARAVHFRRGMRVILDDITIRLHSGEIVALLGANGAGKSTLFRIMLGFFKPERGEVRLNGKPLADFSRRALAQRIAYVPQAHVAPFPYKVRDVVLLGRLAETGIFRAPQAADRRAVDEVLERLAITHLAARRYTEISGGERQLTLIARALAQGASILVLDEPMTGLDYGYQVRLLQHLVDLAGGGRTVLLSTHNPEHAVQAATRIAVLRDGVIMADGPPEQIITPSLIRVLYGVAVSTLTNIEGRMVIVPTMERVLDTRREPTRP
ncbi:ABC transporter, ATPase subunit [Nitrobacter sp. Nb-311A]|uniref:ABC transporter ATP-binding protein n=1 Tax=unclassified Nitrobacter TaxID=2620411 RepID=UPI0000685E07|nr:MULTISPECIES: ABC transporter ATP-binding protein [unclassified Nitrobacter]EAQ35148.1 ABC transporter, ATPase subunit [Nitrobacter sp. Nb-311A]MCB1393914.1 ABC transporter ATP-binding protein [Nitrobacter sp.]MCV0386613.1 ABC transporter ATP-binding protein [Nitrobacter sp.]